MEMSFACSYQKFSCLVFCLLMLDFNLNIRNAHEGNWSCKALASCSVVDLWEEIAKIHLKV